MGLFILTQNYPSKYLANSPSNHPQAYLPSHPSIHPSMTTYLPTYLPTYKYLLHLHRICITFHACQSIHPPTYL